MCKLWKFGITIKVSFFSVFNTRNDDHRKYFSKKEEGLDIKKLLGNSNIETCMGENWGFMQKSHLKYKCASKLGSVNYYELENIILVYTWPHTSHRYIYINENSKLDLDVQ